MKKLIFALLCCLPLCVSSPAQSKFPELDKLKQIKLLESTREDVVRIFGYLDEESEDQSATETTADEIPTEDEESEEEEIDRDEFSTDDLTIRFKYSRGNCSDDENQEWNVAKGKVTEINIIFDESLNAADLKIDLSKLEKIRKIELDEGDRAEETDPDDFIYYDEEKGVSYGLDGGKIENIKFTPRENNLSALCNNETVREDHPTNRDWLIEKLKDRPFILTGRPFANVDELILSKNEITAYCVEENASTAEVCAADAPIEIETKAASTDPTDVLTYNYTVSAGKIVGSGASVVWDLSGVKPGQYTITAGVDNGCGVCGTTRTETVTVRDCPDCQLETKPVTPILPVTKTDEKKKKEQPLFKPQ